MFTRENVRTRISIFFVFYSKRPSASLEPVMSLIFVPNSVRGVHRHQAIVILACHVSSENLCHLHGTTTAFSIVCHAYFARTATVNADYCAFFQPISTTVLGGRDISPSDCSHNTAKNRNKCKKSNGDGKTRETRAAYPIPISLYNCYRIVRHGS